MGRSKSIHVPIQEFLKLEAEKKKNLEEETSDAEEPPAPKGKRTPTDEAVEYEKLRLANIASNEALLQDLMGTKMKVDGKLAASFSVLQIEPSAPAQKKATKPKAKPKPKPKKEEGDEEEASRPALGTRRSARNAGKPATSYKGDGEHIVDKSKMPRMVSRPDKRWDSDDSDEEREDGTVRVNKLVGRVHDPKTFGLIPGVKIGSWWETRAECSAAAIHAPFVAGISGGPEGAYSVALSGGYDDDVDLGEAFTYTGSGGRDLKGTKQNPKNLRTAPQSSDQTFENPFNKALKVSAETKKPVRVIRGFKLPSKYAPKSGYRYDGLYIVESAWPARGNNPKGYLVCKYAFRRIPGQPPIPERKPGDSDEEEEEDELKEEDAKEEEAKEEEAKEEEDVKEESEEVEEEDVEEDVKDDTKDDTKDDAKDEDMKDEDMEDVKDQKDAKEDVKEEEDIQEEDVKEDVKKVVKKGKGAKKRDVKEEDVKEEDMEDKEQSAKEEEDAVKKEEDVKEEEDEPKGRSKRARVTKEKDEPAVPVKRPRGRPPKKK